MKTKILATMVLAAGSVFAGPHFSIGVNIGGGYRPAYYAPAPVYYAPAPAYVAAVPPCPGPGYSWVDGYWSDSGYGRRGWMAGFWRAPVVRYEQPRYERFERERVYDRHEDRFERGFRGR